MMCSAAFFCLPRRCGSACATCKSRCVGCIADCTWRGSYAACPPRTPSLSACLLRALTTSISVKHLRYICSHNHLIPTCHRIDNSDTTIRRRNSTNLPRCVQLPPVHAISRRCIVRIVRRSALMPLAIGRRIHCSHGSCCECGQSGAVSRDTRARFIAAGKVVAYVLAGKCEQLFEGLYQ